MRSFQSLFRRYHYVTGVFTWGLWSLETGFAKLQSYFSDYRRRLFFDFAMGTLAVMVFRLSSNRNRFFAASEGGMIINTYRETSLRAGTSRFKELRVSEVLLKLTMNLCHFGLCPRVPGRQARR